jgi:TorA maturation chaperone TorD
MNLQNEFLRDHLMKWVPEVCRRLKSSDSSSLYKAIAHLTDSFVDLDSGVPDHLTGMLKNAT